MPDMLRERTAHVSRCSNKARGLALSLIVINQGGIHAAMRNSSREFERGLETDNSRNSSED